MPRGWTRREFIGSFGAGALAAGYPRQVARAAEEEGRVQEVDFIDRRWVHHSHFLTRRVQQARRLQGEPILSPGSCFATVLPGDPGFLMWYSWMRRVGRGVEHWLMLARSEDGRTFDKPSLGLREHEGSKANNIVLRPNEHDAHGNPLTGPNGCEGFCVLDAARQPVPHARSRYTAMTLTNVPKRGGLHLFHSEDGLRWTAYPENPVWHGWPDQYNNFFYDPRLKRYVAYVRPRTHAGPHSVNRLVARIESEDLVHWHGERVVLDTDDFDAPAAGTVDEARHADGTGYPRGRDVQFYGMTVTPHQDGYLGFASPYDVVSGTMWCELVHSRDGITWKREAKRDPFIPLGTDGAWDSGLVAFVATGCPCPVGDDWLFYYSGTNFDHHYKIRGMAERGRVRAIGAASVRRGRLVGYEAGPRTGQLLTKTFTVDAPGLFLNAAADRGEVRVEICHENGHPHGKLASRDAVPITDDALRAPVRFSGGRSFGDMRGRTVRLRIHVTDATVFGLAFG